MKTYSAEQVQHNILSVCMLEPKQRGYKNNLKLETTAQKDQNDKII
jgi:hypothetical protein